MAASAARRQDEAEFNEFINMQIRELRARAEAAQHASAEVSL